MKNKQRKLIYKPILRGNWHSGKAALRGLKILAYYGAFAVAFLLMGMMLGFDNDLLRWVTNMALVAICAMILFSVGARAGEEEVNFGEIAYAYREAGKEVSAKELERCYHPLKGWFTFACAAAVILLLTVPHALTAQRQTYSLQPLPAWVTAFRGHEEITAPLSYYSTGLSLTGWDALRVIVRVLVFPFSSAVGVRNVDGMLAVDRLSPLLALIPALAYPIGYLTGPRARAAVHGDISASIRRKQRREKKARQARTEKKNELI